MFLFKCIVSDTCCRPVQSESANTDGVDSENDHYSTLLHGKQLKSYYKSNLIYLYSGVQKSETIENL